MAPKVTVEKSGDYQVKLEEHETLSRLRVQRPNAELFNIEVKPQIVLKVFDEAQQNIALGLLAIGVFALLWRNSAPRAGG